MIKRKQTMKIPLTQGKFSIIDWEDYKRISKYKWYAAKSGKNFYGQREYKNKPIKLHRFIMNVTDSNKVIDHINHDTLDNRKSNLRICTQAENSRNTLKSNSNTSGFKGVVFNKSNGKYRSRITFNRKLIHLGYYNSSLEAHKVYCQKAKELYGEFYNKG